MSKILIIGNIVLDQVMLLPCFPQQDEEMRANDLYTEMGGNACNSAQILSQLGHQLQLMSSLGDDPEAQQIRKLIHAKGIDTSFCVSKPGHHTPYSNIWINQKNGSRTIAHYRDLPELDLADFKRLQLSDYDWVHCEGRNIDTLIAYFESFSQTSAAHTSTLSLELEKPRQNIDKLLPFIDVAIVSSHYLKATGSTAEACIRQLKSINPSLRIAITVGDAGVIGCDSPGNIITIPAIAVSNIIDTIGAGDCFIAGCIDALIRGEGFESSLQSANKLAAFKIQHRGMNIEGYQKSNL